MEEDSPATTENLDSGKEKSATEVKISEANSVNSVEDKPFVQPSSNEERTDTVDGKKQTDILTGCESKIIIDNSNGNGPKEPSCKIEDNKISASDPDVQEDITKTKDADTPTTRTKRKVSLDRSNHVKDSSSDEDDEDDESTDSDSLLSDEEDEDDEEDLEPGEIPGPGSKAENGDEESSWKRKRNSDDTSGPNDDDVKNGSSKKRVSKTADYSSSEEPSKEVLSEKRKRNSVLNVQFSSADEDDESPKKRPRRRNQKSLHEFAEKKPRGKSRSARKGSNSEESKGKLRRGAKYLFKPNVSIHELRRTREVFVQYRRCIDFKKGLIKAPRCLECKAQMNGESKVSVEKCRFFGFRKLKVTPKSTISCGFSDPMKDFLDEDSALWRTSENPIVTFANIENSKFIIKFVGDQFCDLVEEENKTLSLNEGKPVAWKRVVRCVREMCDVCCTTLFNYQWTCEKCGFVACRDCYNSRFLGKTKPCDFGDGNRDEYLWALCINNKMSAHNLDEMMLSQVVVGNDLNDLHKTFHEVRHEWKIPQTCGCQEALKYPSDCEPVVENIPMSNILMTAVAHDSGSDDSSDDEVGDPDLLDLFSTPGSTPTVTQKPPEPVPAVKVEDKSPNNEKRFYANRPLSLSKTLTETKSVYPTIPHSWLCNGKLLRLMDPCCPDNIKLFQEVWKCGQPVLVSKVDTKLNADLWTPQSFSNDYGRMKGIFVNCMTGKLVMNQLMKVFWDGFEIVPNRLEDEQGNTMLLKLKDWPEKADFKDLLPTRFHDLMKALPLQDYTSREGCYNLTSFLPNKFIKPDLGPKMYVAYGSGLHLDKGTTNLHLDISDAVNVMVYVGEPKDTPENAENHRKAVISAIEDSDCDSNTIRRVIEGTDIPGALWHIYEARDADKIRNFLNENKIMQGIRPNDRHDPIHDQSCYLDKKLRKDLMTKYNISGYPIIQCAGDAIFIPAGAPHQVRNLQNCIKVAEDFVSPENVHHCFQLTEEFRRLTEQHSNHEDKLQIKNIVYHSIKDAVSILRFAKNHPDQVDVKRDEIGASDIICEANNVENRTKDENGETGEEIEKMETNEPTGEGNEKKEVEPLKVVKGNEKVSDENKKMDESVEVKQNGS